MPTGPLPALVPFLILTLGNAVFGSTAMAQDVRGASDHTLIERYDGSILTYQKVQKDYRAAMPKEAMPTGNRVDPKPHMVEVSGTANSFRYEGPTERSALDVVRSYQSALEDQGFSTLFYCRAEDCGSAPAFWAAAAGDVPGIPSQWSSNTYALMHKERAEGDIWISIFAIETKATPTRPMMPYAAIRIVEEDLPLALRFGGLSAVQISEQLDLEGRVPLYDIDFAVSSDVMAPTSARQVREIADYLKATPTVRLMVVGHTDTSGSMRQNQILSERRARSVVQALIQKHGISPDRLVAEGVGPAAPVASNATAAGREKNRRVELVTIP
ncbi:OmpA family protein [Parvularcula sp. LCG005]|uniref:OmpA family protein n=1 Tax=Parvularcula sp. LCG005 TaxID=3078805 RepID=UPI0029421FBE|nr:DUF4892 domain-containing protein [Parvularcula sp. LCG005]WOI53598.1 DUF4892 domain-containing protein [Parvularcula sp. LCG005]